MGCAAKENVCDKGTWETAVYVNQTLARPLTRHPQPNRAYGMT